MCGIGGILFSTENKESLQQKVDILNEKQRHRGPDGQFSLVLDQHAFCHQKLDLFREDGLQQPFRDPTERYIIVFNGELYNYADIKQKLSNHYQFITTSDTEIILAAFITWGESCLQHFIGMFAFLIWDTLTETAFAARDHVGVKPFIYYRRQSTFIFASELKALLPLINDSIEIDPYMLAEYVIVPCLSGAGEKAIFKNIRYLEPGTAMRIDRDGIRFLKYYCFNWRESPLEETDLIQSLAYAVDESVKLALPQEAPCGVFLSGGVDSSLIAAIATKYSNTPLTAYSIAFKDHSDIYFDPSTIVNSDDLPFAIELSKILGMSFHQVNARHESLSANLFLLSKINDRIPAWEQEFSQHFLSRDAATKLKTVLIGDASDETNYGYFFLLNEATNSSPMGLINLFGGHERINLLAPSIQKQLHPLHYLDEHYRRITKQAGFDFDKGGEESVLAMSTLVSRRWLGRLLHNSDIHSMHFGLEARVPYANRNVLDIASQVYPHLGYKNEVEKYILRQAAAQWLPYDFCYRKKSALPRDPRLGKVYQAILTSLLMRRNDFIDTFLNRKALVALCEIDKMTENERMMLFNMICLILWSNQYFK